MNDDIVTRLRNACDSNNCWCPMTDERCIYMEAVDEIESLKTLLLMQIAAGISHEKSLIKEIALGRLMEWAEKENVVTYG